MRLFKPKVGIQELCLEFYISHVFRPRLDRGAVSWDSLRNAIADADPAITAVEHSVFLVELNALRMELFGLACVHRLREEKYIVAEVLFTRSYLREMNRLGVWEAMAGYNDSVRAAADKVEPRHDAREGLLAQWVAKGVDQECATRAVNRLGGDESWAGGITRELLADAFQSGVGCRLNEAGAERLKSVVDTIYGLSLDVIKRVKVEAEEW